MKVLTSRELEIAMAVASSLSRKEMATKFGVSRNHIDVLIGGVMKKLGLKGVAEAVLTRWVMEPGAVAAMQVSFSEQIEMFERTRKWLWLEHAMWSGPGLVPGRFYFARRRKLREIAVRSAQLAREWNRFMENFNETAD